MMHTLDDVLQKVTPTVMVPKFGMLEAMETAGHRFLVASNGLWIEVKRAWLDLLAPLAIQEVVAMPYGQLNPKIKFSFGGLPLNLLEEFIQNAKEQSPYECGAWIIWNEGTNTFELRMLEATKAGVGHLTYKCPILNDGEHLVVDIHSHGNLGAFFSSEDNADDAGEVKVALVVGNLDHHVPTLVARICANGLFIEMPLPPGFAKKQGIDHVTYD